MPNRRKSLIIARKSAGLSQQGLADQLGVNRVTLARWELGETDPSLATALQLAKFLGRRVEQLFGDEPLFSPEEVAKARHLIGGATKAAPATVERPGARPTEVPREQRKS